jgi:hypothetical protein
MQLVTYWIFYLIGQAIHILMRARLASLGAKRPIIEYFKENWIPLFARLFLCTLGFITWEEHGWIAEQVQHLTHRTGPVPVTKATAGIFGYFSDSLLAWFFEMIGNKFPMLKTDFVALENKDASAKPN